MLLRFVRNGKSIIVVIYSLYLYFLGLSLRNTSNVLELVMHQKISYVVVWMGFRDLDNVRFKRESGYEYVLNLFINLCLESTFHKRKTCL